MKITSFKVTSGTKFNDPKENYRNHSVGTELSVTLEEGDMLQEAMEAARQVARETVDRERGTLLERCRLQHEFEERSKKAQYALEQIQRYERDTRSGKEAIEKFESMMHELRRRSEELAAQGVYVQVPALSAAAIGNGNDDD